MNRVEFMSQLERLLWDIPESDRQDALCYYNDYFDEAGAENEAQIIQKLGSPGKVAATIKADLNSHGNEHGEYTERGYYDGQEEVNQNPPASRTGNGQGAKQKRNLPWPLIIVLLIFASPLLIGVGGGVLGSVLGIIFSVFGVMFAVLICGVAFLVAGLACVVVGIVRMFFSPAEGLITAGLGSLVLAVGSLLALLSSWCVFKWIPALFRWVIGLIQKLFRRDERRNGV